MDLVPFEPDVIVKWMSPARMIRFIIDYSEGRRRPDG
jgi:hypothetical protein